MNPSARTPDAVRLGELCAQIETVMLARQDPVTGLLPASTAVTVHGDYTDAWVRDNVYSILCVWGCGLALRRHRGGDPRAYRFEQGAVKTMRGLLTAMMKQAHKVERFKHTLAPIDALHAKYGSRTGEPVVADDGWGHLQIDATSVFLLMLVQMIASGLRVVYSLDEVDFVQALAHYIARAYRTPDYGIWERGDKINTGDPEINASSVGMAKAALEALRGFDLFGAEGGPASVIHVSSDDIARMRNLLEATLPRESRSKEVDAALLSVIGFPAWAVEDAELVERTRHEVVAKLQGRYGCKRFLRDGHQTVLEDHTRLHYESGELARFERIESEWPLFFTYLMLDGLMRGRDGQAHEYRERLAPLLVDRGAGPLLPELYLVPEKSVAAEKARPGSQPRLPNANVPLYWAQSLYWLALLIDEGWLHPGDIDPLNRRHRIGRRRECTVQVALIADTAAVETALLDAGVRAQTPEAVLPVRVRQASELVEAMTNVGRNAALGLSGRPRRGVGTLVTCQVFTIGGETVVFLPQFLERQDFYLNLSNRVLISRCKAEFAHVRRHWDQAGQPVFALRLTARMLATDGAGELLDFLRALCAGSCEGLPVRVRPLSELIATAGRKRFDRLRDYHFEFAPLEQERSAGNLLDIDPAAARELDAVDRSGEVDDHPVAVLGAPVGIVPLRVLPAQNLDRAVDVRLADVDLRPLDRHRREVAERDLGEDLEHRRELERLARPRGARVRLDAGIAGDAQVLRPDRLVEPGPHRLGDDVRAHLRPVLLLDHLERHVAGAEAGDLRALREVGEALLHFAFDVAQRHGDVEAALEAGGGSSLGHGRVRRIVEDTRGARSGSKAAVAPVLHSAAVRAPGSEAAPALVRKGGLEPPRVTPPEPKSGASADSATFAAHGPRRYPSRTRLPNVEF